MLREGELLLCWRRRRLKVILSRDAFKLLVLTGQRRSEVAEMKWSEIDLA